MTEVYWLQQVETDLPSTNDWLSSREVIRLASMPFAKRRNDWRLGRWTAKCAVATWLKLPTTCQLLARIEIRAASNGAPEVLVIDQAAPVSISLSHCSGIAVCAVTLAAISLGCDIEKIESRSGSFVGDYFAREEQELISRTPKEDRDCLVTMLWSAKESTLKALQTGLREDTRSVVVSPDMATFTFSPDMWQHLTVGHVGGPEFSGWWQKRDTFVWTIATASATKPPFELRPSAYSYKMPI